MKTPCWATALLLAGTAPLPAWAQGADKPAIPAGSDVVFTGHSLDATVADGPNDRLLRAGLAPELQLDVSEDSTTASFAWSRTLQPSRNPEKLSLTNLTFKASTAIDTDEDYTQVLGGSGFRGGTTLSLNLTRFAGKRIIVTEASKIYEEAALKKAGKRCLKQHFGNTDAPKICDTVNILDGSSGSFIAKYAEEDFRTLMAERLPPAIFYYGVEFSGNQQGFSYLDRNAFTQGSKSKFSYSASAFIGRLSTLTPQSFGASFRYARGYEPSGEITLCQPVPGGNQTKCLTGADGAPSREESAIVAVEYRRAFGNGPSVAIAIEGSADLVNRAFAVDAPVYFIGDGGGGLRGGLRFRYTNARDAAGDIQNDFTAGLFVGVPFKL